MSSEKMARFISAYILVFCMGLFGLDFDDAQKAFKSGRCKDALQMGEQVIQSSAHAPDQVKEDRSTQMDQWQASLEECRSRLPADYQTQLDTFLVEFKAVMAMQTGTAKTDSACELLRKVAVLVSDVKFATADCPCRDYLKDPEYMLREAMSVCPQPCKDMEDAVDGMLKETYLLTSNIHLSTSLLKAKEIGAFRKRLKGYQFQLQATKIKADSIGTTMDYCMGRTGNRNLGLIVGAATYMGQGLAYIEQMCGFIQSLYERARHEAEKNKAFRDSVDNFFVQVNTIVDQWLASGISPDSSQTTVTLQKSTSERMHDMLFKLAEIDLERSLYYLGRPTDEKKKEIARLQSLSFEGQLSPDEVKNLTELRDKVVQKLYESIPWTVRLWDEQRNAVVLVICLGCVLIAAILVLLIVMIKKKREEEDKPHF